MCSAMPLPFVTKVFLGSTDFVINPVLQLTRRQENAKVFGIPCHQCVASSKGLSGNEDIGITLPSFDLPFEVCGYAKRLLIKIQNLKFTQQTLSLPKQLLCTGKLGRFSFQDRL